MLWNKVEHYIERRTVLLILDDTIHSKQIELRYYQWSGKHHSVVKEIDLMTLVLTDRTSIMPVDYRIYDKDGYELTKNDHFRAMLETASGRGFQPNFVMFDSGYSGIDHLKCVSRFGWDRFSRIKKNRMVNPDPTDNRPVSTLLIPEEGLRVHMKKFRFVRVFHAVNLMGKERFWATNLLTLVKTTESITRPSAGRLKTIPRVLKKLCCVEDCKIRKEIGQRNHLN